MEGQHSSVSSIKPELIATYSDNASSSTGDVRNAPEPATGPQNSTSEPGSLRHAQLSPDGTTLLTASVSHTQHSTITTTILPPTLLSTPPPHNLSPYSTLSLPEPIRSISCYPYFDLSNPSTTLLLTSFPEHPIRLTNALSLDAGVIASYPYIRPETEAYLAPHSLCFTPDGARFVAGCDSELGIFDVSRSGADPVERYKLRRNGALGAAGQWRLKRGIISTLDISSEGILAAGTFSREIGLYANHGQGGCVASFCLDNDFTERENRTGSGISLVKWSSCGTYILVGERNSHVVQVFDVRGEHKLLQTLVGRNAESMMRLGWDLTPNGEVWAGGLDGHVMVWEGIGKSEGKIEASMAWKAHTDPVVTTIVHPSGSVAITCSAEDRNAERSWDSPESSVGSTDDDSTPDKELDSPEPDSNIKVWSL